MVRQTPLRAKEPVSALLAGLRLGELPGLDPVPANFVAAATLSCAPHMGPPQQVRTRPCRSREAPCERCASSTRPLRFQPRRGKPPLEVPDQNPQPEHGPHGRS